MRKTTFTILFYFAITLWAYGQEDENVPNKAFEDYPPIRLMKCGLWINAVGDIGYKTVRATEFFDSEDCWLIWTYNIADSIHNADNYYMSDLKNVVDTATFQMLNRFYFKDKNRFYHYVPMSSGGHIGISHVDRKTFRVLENPDFALDKDDCYFMDRIIEGADPKTFRVIPNEDYHLSRDKNHFYSNWYKISGKEVHELEDELGIELFTQADYMNFTTEKFDRLTIACGIDDNKELSLDALSEPYTFILKGIAELSKSEIKKLHRLLLSEKTFTDNIALLSHSDIILSYYKNDTATVFCNISSQTRKFTLVNGERYFVKRITPAFEKYLTALLRKKKLWSKKEGFYDW